MSSTDQLCTSMLVLVKVIHGLHLGVNYMDSTLTSTAHYFLRYISSCLHFQLSSVQSIHIGVPDEKTQVRNDVYFGALYETLITNILDVSQKTCMWTVFSAKRGEQCGDRCGGVVSAKCSLCDS